jgi:hypothetical protein
MPHRCPHTNIWIYPELPENMRPATINDLYTNGKPSGKPFLLQSFFDNHLEAYNYTHPNTEIETIFLPAGKIFVRNN